MVHISGYYHGLSTHRNPLICEAWLEKLVRLPRFAALAIRQSYSPGIAGNGLSPVVGVRSNKQKQTNQIPTLTGTRYRQVQSTSDWNLNSMSSLPSRLRSCSYPLNEDRENRCSSHQSIPATQTLLYFSSFREDNLNLSTPYYASRGVVTASDAVQLRRVTSRS